MAWSPEISQLSTDVAQLTNEINVQKNQLSGAVTSAQTSRITANTGAAIAESSVVPSTTNMQSANTFKTSALSIYGTQAAQQASLNIAAGQAATAATSAITATTGLTQDLSGVTAQPLHRSPNAITSMFVYDTSKDSDGGAWTEKCQHTSWYNEALSGKWLGAWPSEFDARHQGASLGAELVTVSWANGSLAFNTFSALPVGFTATKSVTGTQQQAYAGSFAITLGKFYYFEITIVSNTIPSLLVDLGTSTTGRSNQLGIPLGSSVVRGVFVPTSTQTGASIRIITASAQAGSISVSSVSVKEVISLTTVSNDYFQLTSDGKFYRLWKNLLGRTEEFTSPWVLTSTSLAGSTISGYISAVQFGDNSVQRILRNPASQIAGLTYTISAFVQMDDGLAPVVGAASNLGDFSLVTDDNIATSPVITQIGTTSVYRVSATRVCGITGSRQTGVYKYTTQSARTFKVTGIQLELGSVATTYETKAVEGATSEVFRGNKRDFPRLAGIVAESASVAIYDLTEPGRPMWMRFADNGSESAVRTVVTVFAMNGILATGGTSSGLRRIYFVTDNCDLINNGAYFQAPIGGRPVSQRNVSTIAHGVISGISIAGGTVNTIAMIVLPDAPIDAVTGLKIPTIAVATNAGVSVIRHNGTVVTPYGAESPYAEFTNDYRLRCKRGGTSAFYISSDWRTAAVPTSPLTLNGTSSLPNISLNTNNKGFYAKKQSFMYYSGAGEVAILQENPGTYAKGFVARVTNGFNTGWMPGDIRRCLLSDTDVGFVAYTDRPVTGWNNGGFSTFTPNGSSLVAASAGYAAVGSNPTYSIVTGNSYRIEVNVLAISGSLRIGLGNTANLYSSATIVNTPGIKVIYARATNTGGFGLNLEMGTGGSFSITVLSVSEAITDKSYKASAVSINGIITRSQAAAGTSLVGYSGFSTANYLQEPYSPDLDFGTGEFSASAWVNIPTLTINPGSPPTGIFQVTGSNLVTNGTFDTPTIDWTAYGPAALSIVNNVLRIEKTSAAAPTDFGASLIINFTKPGTYRLSVVVNRNYTITNTTMSVAFRFSTIQTTYPAGVDTTVIVYADIPTAGQHSVTVRSAFGGGTIGEYFTIDNVKVEEVPAATIIDRAHSSGTRLKLAVDVFGRLVTEAFDGTTTRTVTTTATYNTAQWLKAEANYTTDGSLAIRVNGREVAVTRGNPLLTLNSRYNLLTYTEQFDNAIWNKGRLSVTPNIMTDPNEILSADAVFETAVSGIHEITPNQGVTTISGVPYTTSIYVKSNGRSRFRIQFSLAKFPSNQAFFDLSNNTVDNVIGGTASITPLSNGWYRCVFTVTASVTSFDYYPVYLAFVDSGVNTGYLGDVTKGLYLWGAQFEYGAVATTYQRVVTTAETNVAPLTIGNSFTANAPFPGSIALLKLGATVPTPEQSVFMYEQEKQLFRPGALSVLPDANAIIDMSYDDATDRWAAVSTTNESYWNGLVRSSVTAVPSGAYSKITTTSGVELSARITTNPGVDVSIPPYALREEIVKRSEAANRLVRKTVIYDYTGGFTGNITTGSTSILSAANITYPTSYIGARISGTGIPANTVITGVSGTTIYISAPATATTNTLAITFLDFNLPVGMEAKVVLTAGVIRREGSTSDYTRLFDGFIETIRFAVAPGSTAWVQIQATRTAQ